MRSFRFVAPLLVGLSCAATPVMAQAQVAVGVSVGIAPPALPVYVQPPIPAIGYIWTPGYWAWGPAGYYWVPGTWVLPPSAGLYWTPGYWAWENAAYVWFPGYWGPEVGFYGGINYGYGYFGTGFYGGEWRDGHWWYNRGYNNFGGVHVGNVFSHPVTFHASYVSYNGGAGGIGARATAQQEAFAHAQHVPPTALQMQHVQAAAGNHAFLASVNHGRPAIAATSEPGHFSGQGVVGARQAGAPYRPAVVPHAPGASGAQAPQPTGQAPHVVATPHPTGGAPTPYHPAAAPPPHPEPQYHPPAQQYHPPAAEYHAPAQQYHAPAAAPRPEPARPAEHENERKDQQHQ